MTDWPPTPRERLALIQRGLLSGQSYRQIAKAFGVNRSLIISTAWRYGLSPLTARFWTFDGLGLTAYKLHQAREKDRRVERYKPKTRKTPNLSLRRQTLVNKATDPTTRLAVHMINDMPYSDTRIAETLGVSFRTIQSWRAGRKPINDLDFKSLPQVLERLKNEKRS